MARNCSTLLKCIENSVKMPVSLLNKKQKMRTMATYNHQKLWTESKKMHFQSKYIVVKTGKKLVYTSFILNLFLIAVLILQSPSTGEPQWTGQQVRIHTGDPCDTVFQGERVTTETDRLWEEQQCEGVHVWNTIHKRRQGERGDRWTV